MIELSLIAEDFVDAWKRWDEAATRIMHTRDVEIQNGRAWYGSMNTLKPETDRFVDAKIALANELGMNPVHLMIALQELRHDGVEYEKAVHLVATYLSHMVSA